MINTKYIFSDCFNTLLGRKITPNDVLYNWGKKMNDVYSSFSCIDFYKLFKKTWHEIKVRDSKEVENSEFITNINEIFEKIYEVLTKYGLIFEQDKANFVDCAMNKYFEAESESHYLKTGVYNYLLKKKKSGCKIFLVSDFYCSENIICNWLKKVGVNVEYLFDKIYISCDVKASKNSGNIYKYILNENNIDAKSVKMIGDNFVADGVNAKKNGIKYKPVFPQIRLDNGKIFKAYEKFTVPAPYMNIFNQNKDYSYSNIAFPLFLFSKRLADACIRKNIKNLFFLARDGRFLKEIFDCYCEYNKLDINTHYAYISRKSVINASITDYDTSVKGLIDKPFINIRNFLKTLSFTNDEIADVLKDANIKHDSYKIKLYISKAYKKLLKSNVFQKLYNEKKSQTQKEFSNYLQTFNVDINTEGLHIVDSGWFGNMQRYLRNCFSPNLNFDGYYVGIINKNCVNNKTYGLLFSSKTKCLGLSNKILAHRHLIWEELLKTDHGSCVGYKDGQPILEDANEEVSVFKKYIEPLQKNILEKFKQILEVNDKIFCNKERLVNKLFYLMIKHTTKKDRELIIMAQKAKFDGFGYYELRLSLISNHLRKAYEFISDKLFILKNLIPINIKRMY